ncbi:hypothetical protein [Spirosoma sp. KNUC1025]|uniref:hypothetical protein n=1 Tax=Spirosoma sp. KNUC1025 TaxID=2894082 RepID=UPI00386700E9|nr:hypothetical protein LN737_23525 [Spirosoma sp. KNUC1025]
MNEYTLNRLTPNQLAELANSSATFLITLTRVSVKIDLYHIRGHFIEVSYSAKKLPGGSVQWQLYSANHYPDSPANTKYLAIYLHQIELPFD